MDIRNREEANKASSRKTKTYGIDIESALDVEPHSEERACPLLSEPSSPKRLIYRGSPQGFWGSGERKEDYILVQRKSSVKRSLHPAHRTEWKNKGSIHTSATVRSSKRSKCIKEAERRSVNHSQHFKTHIIHFKTLDRRERAHVRYRRP